MFTPPAFSTHLAGFQPAVQAARPTPAGQETGGTPLPGQRDAAACTTASPSISLSTSGEGRGEAAPWQRLDAAWPVIDKSPTGLDGDAQRLVRSLLTQAAGKRLQRRRQLQAAALWIWEPIPHLAEYVRQRRFFAPGFARFQPPDLCRMLRKETRLGLEVLATPPKALGVEVWQELLELQCKRIGQLYSELQRLLGRMRAQQELQSILEALV